MDKLVCIRPFDNFKYGKSYNHWTNFGGLNHIVSDELNNCYPFDGPLEQGMGMEQYQSERAWIFDYFMTIEEWRDLIINKIIEVK